MVCYYFLTLKPITMILEQLAKAVDNLVIPGTIAAFGALKIY